jgi:hypothetical protein
MLIAAGDAVLHPNHGTDTRAIGWDEQVAGERLPEHYSFAGVRLMSGVFAVAHFRAAHLDAFQLSFALVALLCFAVSARRGQRSSPWLEFALGAACGLAIMVKLNAVLGIYGRTRVSGNDARNVSLPLFPGVGPCLLPGAPRFGRSRGKMARTSPVAGAGAGAGGNYNVVAS